MGLRQAINEKCRDCIYDECSPGTWREQVAACAAVSCPLWRYRPAATSGPLANPPRIASQVTPEWRAASIACLKSGQFQTDPQPDIAKDGSAALVLTGAA